MSGSKDFRELVTTDVFEMSRAQLKDHIADLRDTKRNYLRSVTPSVNQLNEQIELAQHELSSRTATRLATVSIVVSTFAIAIAAVGSVS